MKENFQNCLNLVLVSEGGKVVDVGGRTNQGVTQRTFDRFLRLNQARLRNVYTMTDEERNEIYRSLYWVTIGGDLLPIGVDYTMFDAAVNSGVARALHWRDKAESMLKDGSFINEYNLLRLMFMKSLHPSWEIYGRGWGTRVVSVRRISLAMAKGTYVPPQGKVS